MTNARKHNPTRDLEVLSELVQEFKKTHSPFVHDTVRAERACKRCQMIKAAEKSLNNLHEHRANVIEKLEVMFG